MVGEGDNVGDDAFRCGQRRLQVLWRRRRGIVMLSGAAAEAWNSSTAAHVAGATWQVMVLGMLRTRPSSFAEMTRGPIVCMPRMPRLRKQRQQVR